MGELGATLKAVSIRSGGGACVQPNIKDKIAGGARNIDCSVDASGDARDLLAMIRERAPEGEVLHVRGVDQTGDLSAELLAKGIRARSEILYAAEPVSALPENIWAALSDGVPILIHSAKGAERFVALADAAQQLDALRASAVIAISAAAAEPLRRLGVQDIRLAKQPDETALFAALEKRLSARA